MRTLVIHSDLDQLSNIDWGTVSRVLLVNVGQDDFNVFKRDVTKFIRSKIFSDPTIVVLFPSPDGIRVTRTLLHGIGLLYSNHPEVIADSDII